MSHEIDNSILVDKHFDDSHKREHSRDRLQTATLKDVPLSVRRKDAKEPLFLIRYE